MQIYKKSRKNFFDSQKNCTFAPAFRRNRWQEVSRGLLCCVGTIKVAEEAFATGKKFPEFKAGDTITVAYKIIEGSKERIQLYRGVVIKISGHEDKKRFTVRKMSGTVGVERIFPIESPNIQSIEINKVGKLTGKAARIKEKRHNVGE